MTRQSTGPAGKKFASTVYSRMFDVVSVIVCQLLDDSVGSFQATTVRLGLLPSEFSTIHRRVIGFAPSSTLPTGELQTALAVLAVVEKL